jgi:lysophospholipase L1-like esterase
VLVQPGVTHAIVKDAVVDFDKALRDPAYPTRMLPIYDCGDHLHPSDLGYNTMGDAVDLALFD